MKKNIFFLVSAGIIIMLSIYTILFVNNIVNSYIEVFNNYNQIMSISNYSQIIDLLKEYGSKLLIALSIIAIIANLIYMFLIIKNDLAKNKKALLILTIISILTCSNDIVFAIAIINLILIINIKSDKNINSKSVKKIEQQNNIKQIPEIEYKKASKREIIFGVFLLFTYFSTLIWGRFIPNNYFNIALFFFYIILIILSIIIFYPELKNGINNFKNNKMAYIKFLLPKYILGYLIMIVLNIIVVSITNSVSVNQATLETQPIWFIVFGAIIYAPIVEEIVFRGVIRRCIPNRYAFIIISGLFFGYIHAVSEATLLNVILVTLPYAALGVTLAYMYSKTNNIIGNIFIHSLHNTIVVILMVLFRL